MKTRVVITGLGIVSPIGIGKDVFWKGLSEGKCGIGRISYFDVKDYPCQVDAEVKEFKPEEKIDRKKVRRMDKFTQYAVYAANLAVDDSGLKMESEDPDRVGVIVGSGIGGLQTIEQEHIVLREKGARRVSPFLIPKLITNMAGAEIAMQYNMRGPNYAVSSACATSNHAMGDALRLLRYGDADVMISGGAEASITPLGLAGFCSAGAVVTTFNETPEKACRPFDAKRAGFIMGEGAGIIVLETLEHAKKRGAKIYCELAGYGATDDAFHITAPNPDMKAAISAMKRAIADAEMKPEEFQYINAHGTSTPLNDKTETAVIKQVFGEHAKKLAISSTKSMMGHMLGAAGAAELIATVLSMQNEIVHPTINYEFPDPECDLDYVPNKARPLKIQAALSNSLGFGGHNAAVVVRKLPAGA